jgi:hypothetical protein
MRLAAVALIGWLAMWARAGTLDVPAQYPTIQAALDAAGAGDTIVVQPGTYAEALVLPAFDVTLTAPGGPDVTVVDATGLGTSAVTIPNVESTPALIEGLAITGGAGTLVGSERWGGGVLLCGGGRATLRDCRITGNSALVGYGGGISVGCGGGPGGKLTLEDCEVSGNVASSGGGLSAFFSVIEAPTLVRCAITDNQAVSGHGGGLYVVGSGDMQDCLVADNDALGGGGMYVYLGSFSFTRSTFQGNSAVYGGGLVVSSSSPGVRGLTFIGNSATSSGGAVSLSSSCDCLYCWPISVANCLFSGNTTAGAPYSIDAWQCSTSAAFVSHCTFIGESAADGIYAGCILRGVPAAPLNATLTYCDVEGGWPGEGNFDADPLFANPALGDYHLLPASPCRNAGPPGPYSAGQLDFEGDPRVLEGHVDVGMDEFADDCNGNAVPDWQELEAGTLLDCDDNGLPDDCEPWIDCNGNGVRDACDLASGTSTDCDGSGVPDECEPLVDCNGNGVPDACDIEFGASTDCNGNGMPDECEPLADCDGNGVFDDCESGDCNGNGVPDVCDIVSGASLDTDANGVPDECHAILRVPSQYPTLWAAFDAAASGDTVLVEPGVLTGPGNIDVDVPWGKSLLVAGETGAADCIIDCAGAGRAFNVTTWSITLRGLTIRNGNATGGGAVLVSNAGLALVDCRLLDNASGGNGGGAVRVSAGGEATLTGCVLAGNVSVTGGAIAVQDAGSATITRCTFQANSATGGALGNSKGGTLRVQDGSSATLLDSILRDGSAAAGAEIQVQDPGSSVDVAWCDVEGGQAGVKVVPGASLAWGPGILDADPLFKDAAGDDLRLSGGSPCIDTGDPSGAPDADGTPPDMGALPFSPFEDLGHALSGAAGTATLTGTGTAIAGDLLTVTLAHSTPGAPSTWVLGSSLLLGPFKGGVMVPDAEMLLGPLVVGLDGTAQVSEPWPAGVPSGFLLWVQAWWPDVGGPAGFAASNGLAVEAR